MTAEQDLRIGHEKKLVFETIQWDHAASLSQPTEKKSIHRLDTRFSLVWQWINWARQRIVQLECEVDSLTTHVSEMETRIIEMEQHLSGNPPSSLITSTSAVEARDQFAIDNEELGRNVVTKLSNIPRDFAVKLCHRYLKSGSEVGSIDAG